MSEKILFTGERYIPEYFDNNNDEIISEHESRYRSISSLINNKVVLDAACGSGYGSFEISKFAKNVIGIDISNESIEYCKDKFKSNNLSYEVASVTELPFENDKFDIVISFETIEHISEDQQYLFLSQVKRVLKKDGCFVVSTPDKLIYSDKKNYKNEFHIKEFYEEEFYVFLNKFFKNIKFYYQSDEICNLIYSSESKEIKISEIKNSIIKGKYIIAVCSNEALNDDIYLENISIDNNKLINLQNRILELQVEVEEKNNWAFALIEELKQKDQNIESFIKELKQTKQALDVKSEEINNLKIELKNLYTNKSWKLTKPLRYIMRKSSK